MDKWHNYFMDVAKATAELSHAVRLKVGAVAVKDKRIICCGYNGTPAGFDNECEFKDYGNNTTSFVLVLSLIHI